jgi:hypothetical protein
MQLGGAWPGVAAAVQVLALLGAGLLVPAGVAKLRRPADAADALGWRSARAHVAVRTIGLGELALAVTVVAVGGRLAAAVLALTYLAFAGVAFLQRRRGASCGCFGQAEAPAGLLHVAVNVVVATAAAVASLGSVPVAVGTHLRDLGTGTGLLAALVIVVAVATVQQLLTGLPELRAATHRVTLPAPRTAAAGQPGPWSAPGGNPGPGGVR